MKFDLADLHAFVAVARLESFTAAAAEMNLSQSALSRRIEKIEIALETALFVRTTRKVSLTAFGSEFLRRATDIIRNFDEAMFGLSVPSRSSGGKVTISCMTSSVRFFLPKILKSYRKKYPNVRVRIIEEGAQDAVHAVRRGIVDFAFNNLEEEDVALSFTEIVQDPIVLACHSGHPFARRVRVRWSEIGDGDYMTVSKASQNRLLIDQALAKSTHKPKAFFEARHVSTLVSLVEDKMGIAAVPRIGLPPEPTGGLMAIPLVDPIVSRTVGLISRAGEKLSPVAQSLFDEFLAVKR